MSDTKPNNSNAYVFSPHDVTLRTVESFIRERNVYEEAVNARNIVLKTIDRSRPAHTSVEISNAEAAVASARVLRNGSVSLPTFPIATDASRILGHVPIGYARGDVGGTYAHPRYEVANETGDAADCTTTTIQLAAEPPATDLYLAKRICSGEIALKGRTVAELSWSGVDEGLPATSLGLSSIVANRMGARLTVVLASNVSPASQANEKKEIPQSLVDTIEHNVWSRQREQDAKATTSCEEGEKHQNDSKESINEADNKEAQTPSRGSNMVVRYFALGESADTKNTLSTLVHNVGFDVILAAIPTSIWSNFEENETRNCIERLFTTIAACLSKDRSAAAFACFDRSPHCVAQFLDEICGELGLDFVKIDEASLVSNRTAENSNIVVCYKLFLRLDEAGLPLDPFQYFDVVVQGTGMSESFLSAALARAGKKVLHVDAGSNYGGSAFASLDLGSFHRQYCLPLKPDGSYGDGHKQFYGSAIGENCYHQVQAKLLTNRIFVDSVDGEEKPPVLSEREVRQTMIDAVPLYCFSRGPLINTLVDGRAGRNLEFMTVDRVVIIEPHKKDKASSPSEPPSTPQPSVESISSPSGGLAARRALLAAKRMAKTASESVSNAATNAMGSTTSSTAHTFAAKLVPFSRSDVFRGGNSLFTNPLEARRAMKFFKDLEKSFDHTAEDSGNENELDKRVEMARHAENEKSPDEGGDDQAAVTRNQKHRVLCADGETYRRPLPWEEPSQDQNEPLEAFLSRHYGLSAATIDLLTMGGALVPYAFSLAREEGGAPPTTTLSASINLVRTSLASVGRFGVGDTPLLCPMYGAGEVPQNMCRISAVWDATFILRRCVRGLFSCSESDHGNKCVVLSNGQRIQTKAVVLPREIAEYNGFESSTRGGGGLLRSVMVLSSPFISWKQLEDRCNDNPPSDDSVEEANQRELRDANKFPVMLGIIAGSDKTHPIVIHQVGASTGHAPYTIQRSLPGADENDASRLTIVHFSADCKTMSREIFEETIKSLITSTDPSEASNVPKGETGVFYIPSSAVLYHATFILEAETVAEHSCGGPVFRSLLVGDNVGHKDSPGSIYTTSSLLVPSTANPICAADSQDSIGDASNSKDMQTLKASGVPSLLNDSSYVCEAIALYKRIMNHLRSEQPAATEAQTTTMPFLYKLPDPAGRASDDDEDCENHASYAQRLLADAKGES